MKRALLTPMTALALLAARGASAVGLEDASASAGALARSAAFSSFGTCALAAAPSASFMTVADAGAPDFRLPDVEGKEVSLSGYRGKVVLLDFWASWCPPCQASTPFLQKLHEKRGAAGLVVLGVNLREDRSVIEGYLFEKDVTYRVAMDADGSTAAKYQVRGVPTFVLVGRDGRILWRASGFTPSLAATMAEKVEAALSAARP